MSENGLADEQTDWVARESKPCMSASKRVKA